MRILKILAWIVFPYIMIFVDWKVMPRSYKVVAILYTSIVILSFCANSAAKQSTPVRTSDNTNQSQATSVPANTVDATSIPEATKVPPTETSIPPTETSVPPTETSIPPTETSVPPTETSVPIEPVVLTGKGDAIQDFTRPFGAGLYTIEGNKCGRYFGVTSYDDTGKQVDLLVNTTEPYVGVRPLDFGRKTSTRLEIKSECAWKITISPLSAIRVLDLPGQIDGKGDDVILLRGGTPDIATVTGNASGRYFGVFSYGQSSYDVMVNTTDPYQGKVIVNADTLVLEVKSEDKWTISVSTR